tara:strand:+ start:1068 stop:1619 length:552 start_codon:yes stop_codon:yes gene_type:complete
MDNPAFCTKRLLLLIGLIAVIIISDQLTKWWVLEFIIQQEHTPLDFFSWLGANERLPFYGLEVLPFFNLVMVWNEGVSFGLMSSLENSHIWLSLLSIAVSTGLAVWMVTSNRLSTTIPLAMVIGGALGNVIDRLRFGAVADFIDLHLMGYHWPAFNLADAMITIGVALLLIDGLFFEPRHKKG